MKKGNKRKKGIMNHNAGYFAIYSYITVYHVFNCKKQYIFLLSLLQTNTRKYSKISICSRIAIEKIEKRNKKTSYIQEEKNIAKYWSLPANTK